MTCGAHCYFLLHALFYFLRSLARAVTLGLEQYKYQAMVPEVDPPNGLWWAAAPLGKACEGHGGLMLTLFLCSALGCGLEPAVPTVSQGPSGTGAVGTAALVC